jgi:hypothetical protein
MTTETKAAQTVGDYDLRGPDYETVLIGPVCIEHMDAARLVRREFSNGFPNWELYRAAYCGDSLYRPQVRAWCVAYAIAYCEAGGVRSGLPAEEIGCLAGWDAYYALLKHKWLIAGRDVADVAGVDPKTYRKVRNHVYGAMRASLREYWELLNIAIRQVVRMQRWEATTPKPSKYRAGRGFEEDADYTGTGCFIAVPRGSGC